MYLNVLTFTNGKTLAVQTETPYSVDKVYPEWNLITDDNNGQILSFRGSEIVTIATAPVIEEKKRGLKTGITTE